MYLFLACCLVSNLGTWMHAFSEQWVVLQLAGPAAAAWAGRLGLASGLALLVFLPFGGTLADRFEPRTLLGLTQASLMASAMAVGLLALRPHGLSLARLVGFAVFAGLAAALAMPASWAVLRRLAPPDRFTQAYAMFIFQYDLSRMAGPTLAALVLPVLGVAANFFINALSYLGLFWLSWRLGPAPGRAADPATFRPAARYRDLFRQIRRDPGLRASLVLAAGFGLGAWNHLVLLPVYASRYLGFGARGIAGLMTLLGLGALGASLGLARHGLRDERRWIPGCFALYGALLVLWGAVPRAPVALALCLLIGPVQALMWLLLNARVQRLCPSHLAGRTTALFLTLGLGLMPIGNLVAGELAQALGWPGPRWVLAGFGLAFLALAGPGLARDRGPAPQGPG